MAFFDYFGFSFNKKNDSFEGGLSAESDTVASFVAPETYDGTQVIETGGFMSSVYDFGGSFIDENSLIRQYRSMSLYPEVDMAIEDIITQTIVYDGSNNAVKLDLDNVELSDNIKGKIQQEFNKTLKLLDFRNKGYDIFRRWYVDGRVYFQNIINTEHPELGILELRPIDPIKIRKIRKVEKHVKSINGSAVPVIKKVDEHYIYTDFESNQVTATTSAALM